MLALPALLESVADNKKWTLRECEDYAIANNISVKQSEVARVKQTYTLSTARNKRLPDLSATLGENVSFGRGLTEANTYDNTNTSNTSLQLQTSVPLFTGRLTRMIIRTPATPHSSCRRVCLCSLVLRFLRTSN